MHKLSSDTSKLISSSQVITSIVSVVKELLENSLDADATAIEIRLENYGLNKIEVRDNGNGIDHEAVKVAAQCHYTSKISSHIDLQSLTTYGFRGEALSSLCEMSQVCLTTRTADESHSTQYTLDKNGNITTTQPSHLGKGTTITARNLFHNIPVRKQFYNSIKKKKDQLKLVEDIVMAFGLIHHHVRISLWNDKSLIWQKHATSSSRVCVQNVLGTPVFSKLTNVKYTADDGNIVLEGYLPITTQGCDSSTGMAFRKTNERSFLYVNKRPIRDKEIDKTLKKLLGSENDDISKNSKKWPVMVLNITLPLSAVDANVEADKRKVATPLLAQIVDAIKQLIESEKLKLTETPKTTNDGQKTTESSGVILEDQNVTEQQPQPAANHRNFDSTVQHDPENVDAFCRNDVSCDKSLGASTNINLTQSTNERSTNGIPENHQSIVTASNRSSNQFPSDQPKGMLSSTQKPNEQLNAECDAWSRGEAILTQSDIQPVKILTNRVQDNKEPVTHKRERVKDLANQGGFEGLSPIAKKSRIEADDTFDLMFSMDEHDFELRSNKENEPKTINNTLRFDESALKTPTHRKKDDKAKQRKVPRHSFISNWTVVKERENDSEKSQSNAFGNNSDVILRTTQTSLEGISNKAMKRNNKSQIPDEDNNCSLIGNVNYDETIAGLLLINNAFYLTNNQHFREISLYHKLLENHTFAPNHLPTPEVVRRRTLQPSAIFALEDMETIQSNITPSVIFKCQFLEKNGIQLKQFTDPESNRVMIEVHSYPVDIPDFDIHHINELLHNITLQGDNKTISNTRPEICNNFLKKEATRISSTMPGNLSLATLKELQSKTKDFVTLTCLHQKPVFTNIHTF